MRLGLTGFASLSWPNLMRLRASNPLPSSHEKTAVIMVWLPGGCSHLDSYDPKPEIGSEYRGPFKTIETKVPGLQFTELLPLHAQIADKFTILRSMSHRGPGHPAGSMQMLSGDPDERDKTKPKLPDWMSVVNYLRSKGPQRTNPLPRYVGVNPPLEYNGPAYLGDAYSPFSVQDDPNRPNFEVPNIGLANPAEAIRLGDRVAFRQSIDNLERSFDREGELGALDQFETQAMTLLTNPQTRKAFDLSQEDRASATVTVGIAGGNGRAMMPTVARATVGIIARPLPPAIPPVAVANPRVLLAQVEGVSASGGWSGASSPATSNWSRPPSSPSRSKLRSMVVEALPERHAIAQPEGLGADRRGRCWAPGSSAGWGRPCTENGE